MKKHLMAAHGKHYLHVASDGVLIDSEYELIDIKTYCGKQYATVEEAVAGNVFKSVAKGDTDNCKTCLYLARGYKDQRELRAAAASKRVY